LVAGSWMWESTLRALDALGFGYLALREPFAARHASVTSCTRWLVDLMDRFQIASAYLVGGSFGSLVALDYAVLHPQRVATLVLSGAPVNGRSATMNLAMHGKLTLRVALSVSDHLFWDRRCIDEAVIRSAWEFFAERRRLANLVRLLRDASAYDVRGVLPRIEAFTLMIWGEDDRISFSREWRRLLPLIRRGVFHTIARCGHNPMIEKPAEFNALLFEHFGSQGRSIPSSI